MIPFRILLLFLFISVLYAAWIYQVNRIAPQPYLDEVFHIRQAQAYCAGHFHIWDPKITTPPGLYIISHVLATLVRPVLGKRGCEVVYLRLLNTIVALFVLPLQVGDLYRYLHGSTSRETGDDDSHVWHTALNISIFPLLFFFSGLYYTDVSSVSLVLGAYQYHCHSLRHAFSLKSRDGVMIFFIGICALFMRQTNIFWVAVFLAGLHAVHHVQKLEGPPKENPISSDQASGDISDLPVRDAYLEDYVNTAFSLVTAALKDPIGLLLGLWPYLALLASFALFVCLNGGVVLGDRQNHIASLHLPQMLYFWPFIMFFSWPIILPHLLHLVAQNKLIRALPRPVVVLAFSTLMALAVHFNTIIHPFTLADNRHYVFYVFRILLRTPLTKYAAVPVYLFCAWSALVALAYHPKLPSTVDQAQQKKRVAPATSVRQRHARSAPFSEPSPTCVSFLLVFLASATLSLASAPLVEPRYFIIPWLIWRLNARPPHLQSISLLRSRAASSWLRRVLEYVLYLDASMWLSLETAWFMILNLATCWMFLYRGFEWKQEPAQVQRFLW